MEKHTFKLTISGSANQAKRKAKAAARLVGKLPTDFIERLADVAENEPDKVALAKKFLGV